MNKCLLHDEDKYKIVIIEECENQLIGRRCLKDCKKWIVIENGYFRELQEKLHSDQYKYYKSSDDMEQSFSILPNWQTIRDKYVGEIGKIFNKINIMKSLITPRKKLLHA